MLSRKDEGAFVWGTGWMRILGFQVAKSRGLYNVAVGPDERANNGMKIMLVTVRLRLNASRGREGCF